MLVKRWQMVCIYLHHCPLLVVDTIYQGISNFRVHPRKNEHGSWTSTVWKSQQKQQIPNLPWFGFLDGHGKPTSHAQVVSEERIRELCDEDGHVVVEGGGARLRRGSTKWGDRISSEDLMFSRFSHASFTWMFQRNLVICWCCLNYFDGPKVFGHSPTWEAFRWRGQSPTAQSKPKEGMHNHQNLGDDTYVYLTFSFVPMVIFFLDGSSMIDEVNLVPG